MHLFFTTSCRDTSRITVSFSNVVISFRLFVEFLFPRSIQFSSTFRNFIESHQTDSVTIRSSNFRGFSYYKYYFIFNILKFLKRFVDFLLNILGNRNSGFSNYPIFFSTKSSLKLLFKFDEMKFVSFVSSKKDDIISIYLVQRHERFK